MTDKEAIRLLENVAAEIEWDYPLDYAVAIEKGVEALRRQIPKKVVPFCKSGIAVACPNCGTFQDFIDENTLENRSEYCFRCGQPLDWSEIK